MNKKELVKYAFIVLKMKTQQNRLTNEMTNESKHEREKEREKLHECHAKKKKKKLSKTETFLF